MNWFAYATCNPTNYVDPDGKVSNNVAVGVSFATLGLAATFMAVLFMAAMVPVAAAVWANVAVFCFALSLGAVNLFAGVAGGIGGLALSGLTGVFAGLVEQVIVTAGSSLKASAGMPGAAKCIMAATAYALLCIGALAIDSIENPEGWQ